MFKLFEKVRIINLPKNDPLNLTTGIILGPAASIYDDYLWIVLLNEPYQQNAAITVPYDCLEKENQ